MNIKRFFAVLTAALICIASALPLSAIGRAVVESDTYIDGTLIPIGWNGVYVSLRADGSFDYTDGENAQTVVFGKRAYTASCAYDTTAAPYPVTTHTFSLDGLSYTLRQFVLAECDRSGQVLSATVYSRLKVKNNTDVSVPFPAVSGGAVTISEKAAEISSGKTETCEYATVIKRTDGQETAQKSYKDAEDAMRSMWDKIFEGTLEISKSFDVSAVDFRRSLVEYNITKSQSTLNLLLTSREYASLALSKAENCYTAAVALMKTGDTETAAKVFPSLKTKYEAYESALGEHGLSEGLRLYCRDLSENLTALTEIWSYAYVAGELSADDESLEEAEIEAREAGKLLAESIASAIKDLQKQYKTDWETVTSDRGIVVNGKDHASANALCDWYINNAVFATCPSSALRALAIEALDYRVCKDSDYTFVSSLIAQREDGTLIIGRGAPEYYLADKASFSVKNYTLFSGAVVSLKVEVEKKDVAISLSCPEDVAVQAEFSAFRDNIEYASAGFDSETGIVTAPEGTTFLEVRLSEKADKQNDSRIARTGLEAALALAYEQSPEESTSVSREIFEKALSSAEKARSSTTSKQLEAKKKLESAISTLSPMTAGYTHVIPDTDIPLDSITYGEVYQKFTLPSDGTVTELFVSGQYCDGISCAVYTLRGDAYTTDELRAETYGEEAEGGIVFDLDFEAVGGQVYVLCIFCDDADITLSLVRSTTGDNAHIQTGRETTVYSGASLGLEFTVEQVHRADLDTFYSACLEADVSEYTKESQKKLKKALDKAEKLLCTPSVTEDEYDEVYDGLKAAYDGLDTYASQDKMDEAPIVGLVLIGVVIVLLVGTFLSALFSKRKMNE